MVTESESERGFFQALFAWDREVFHSVNVTYAHPSWDAFFLWLRHPNSWLPLYILLFLFFIFRQKWYAIGWLLSLSLLITISDGVSSHFLKHWIGRARPFSDEHLVGVRLLLDYRPANPSFPSSHAVNHFAVAVFFPYTLFPFVRSVGWRWVVGGVFGWWAAMICYAQVYVGVHYPLDVLGGMVLGVVVGWVHCRYLHPWLAVRFIAWCKEKCFRALLR